jgi:hypothetical protein
MSKRLIRLSILSAVAALALSHGAGAAAPGEPTVSARAFAPLPDGASVAVEPRDDNDTNLQLRDLIARRLEGKLHPALPGAALRLRFSTETVSSAGPKAGEATGEAVVASDRKSFTPTNLDYTEADRFLGGPPPRAIGPVQTTYRLRATLETRAGGKVLWSGEASGALSERNEARLATSLAEALADTIGRTVDTQVASVDDAPRLSQTRSPTSLGPLRLPYAPATAAASPTKTPLAALPELAERPTR